MTNSATLDYPFLAKTMQRAETPIAAAQNGLACWSRAWAQVAHGFMAAGLAQIELARAVYAVAPIDPANVLPNHDARAAGREWVHGAHARFETAVNGYRRINDELAATLFSAAEGLIEGLPDETHDAAAAAPVSRKKVAA
jgi:hypothetical protein